MDLLILAIAALAALAALNFLLFKGKVAASESVVIAKPPAEVYAKIADLRSWLGWSPWMSHEPDCDIEYSTQPDVAAVGGYFAWRGRKVGIGKLTQRNLIPHSVIEQRIEFRKPLRMAAMVTWRLEADGGGTRVTWGMHGQLPFALRALAARINNQLAVDYRCGLQLLRQELDPTAPRMDLTFHGISHQQEIRCLGHDFEGDLDGMRATMREHFPRMEAKATRAGRFLCVMSPFDHRTGKIKARLGVETPGDASEPYELLVVPGGLYLKTELRGGYDMLGIAWRSAFTNLGMNKLKLDGARDCYEVYDNDPRAVPAAKLLTSIYLPVKR